MENLISFLKDNKKMIIIIILVLIILIIIAINFKKSKKGVQNVTSNPVVFDDPVMEGGEVDTGNPWEIKEENEVDPFYIPGT